MRRRSLRTQRVLGAIVALFAIVAVPVVYLATRDGIDAVRVGDASTAAERLLLALAAAAVPLLAVALYAHWLYVTTRPQVPHQAHIPTWTEEWFLGIATGLTVVAAPPVVWFTGQQSMDGFADRDLLSGVLYALLAVVYVAFASFALVRYVSWMR